jgi:hypothetical protein
MTNPLKSPTRSIGCPSNAAARSRKFAARNQIKFLARPRVSNPMMPPASSKKTARVSNGDHNSSEWL